jgi:hypothetical protein
MLIYVRTNVTYFIYIKKVGDKFIYHCQPNAPREQSAILFICGALTTGRTMFLCGGTARQVNRLSEGHNTFTLQHVIFNTPALSERDLDMHKYVIPAKVSVSGGAFLSFPYPKKTPELHVQCTLTYKITQFL